jgi:hypothetical protein
MIYRSSWHLVSSHPNESLIVPLEYFQAFTQAEEELLKNFEDCQSILEPKFVEVLAVTVVPCNVK